jgi:hypothetical protein
LTATAALWPAVAAAFGWVERAADLLTNAAGRDGAGVQAGYERLLAEMAEQRGVAGRLAPAVDRFPKVTGSYWPGLFHCYDVPDLPRTNNDLEHVFGAVRHHERRATGRKQAAPALVVRGAVRVVAAIATRQRTFTGADLAPRDLGCWRQVRQELDYRHAGRRAQFRFRRNPASYLAALEDRLLKSGLPS